MDRSRRRFLVRSSAGLLSAAVANNIVPSLDAQQTPAPGTPPAFGTAPAVGPEVSAATFAEAEKLVRVEMTEKDRAQAASNWRESMAPLYERRTGPRKVALEPDLQPWSRIQAVQPGQQSGPDRDRFVRTAADPGPLPGSRRSHRLRARQLSSPAGSKNASSLLNASPTSISTASTASIRNSAASSPSCLSTHSSRPAAPTRKSPLATIAARSTVFPGVQKISSTPRDIPTTYGAEPFRTRIPEKNAAVVDRLNNAGAVLIAKLSMGALALNDIWFGGQTMNPWNLEEGSSGSSAGPGAATAAGLVAFAIGSETGGSIVGPSMRCGITGLRPTYGRVPRTGAMTLCWSLDKLGPMARFVEDTLLVLNSITGPDTGDLYSVPSKLDFDAAASVRGLRVGYFPRWMNEDPATEVDRAALHILPSLGMVPVEVSLPDWPYDDLDVILFAESAAAFEEITLDHELDQLRAQVPDAWPNTFRQSRFLSAVDFVQADRFRRKVANEMARIFTQVDLLLVPSLRDEMLTLTNFTGHPSLTLRAGFIEVSEARSDWAPDPAHPLPKFNPPRRVPHGVTLIAKPFDEGILGSAGIALERVFNVAEEHPPGF